MAQKSRKILDVEDAQAIALQALSFLVAEPNRSSRFMALTGMTPTDIRDAAHAPSQLASTLDYVLTDESLLLAFCQETHVDPATIWPASDLLSRSAT